LLLVLLGKVKPRNVTYIEKARVLADLFFSEPNKRLSLILLETSFELDPNVSSNNIKVKLALKSNISVLRLSRFTYRFLKACGKLLLVAFTAFILAIIKTGYYL
jgi:hypothetical protein